MLQTIEQPIWHLRALIQKQKHKDELWNMFKINYRHWNDIIDCVMSSRQGCCLSVFTDNFENISHLVLVFLLLTLKRQMPAGENISGTKV